MKTKISLVSLGIFLLSTSITFASPALSGDYALLHNKANQRQETLAGTKDQELVKLAAAAASPAKDVEKEAKKTTKKVKKAKKAKKGEVEARPAAK